MNCCYSACLKSIYSASGERVMVKVDVAVGFTSSTVEAGISVCALLSSLEAVSQWMGSVGLQNMPVENLIPLLPSQCSEKSGAWSSELLSS